MATANGPGSTAPRLAQAAATTGAGNVIDFGQAVSAVTWQINVTGTVTAGQVSMELSNDGVTWFTVPSAALVNLSAATLANPYVAVSNTNALFTTGSANIACRYARANIGTTITGGATATVTVMGY